MHIYAYVSHLTGRKLNVYLLAWFNFLLILTFVQLVLGARFSKFSAHCAPVRIRTQWVRDTGSDVKDRGDGRRHLEEPSGSWGSWRGVASGQSAGVQLVTGRESAARDDARKSRELWVEWKKFYRSLQHVALSCPPSAVYMSRECVDFGGLGTTYRTTMHP